MYLYTKVCLSLHIFLALHKLYFEVHLESESTSKILLLNVNLLSKIVAVRWL